MRPRADEVLRSAIATYDTYILPEVHEPFAASLALTVGNLLRHVLARIELEGQALFDDNRDLAGVLLAVEAFVVDTPAAQSVPGLAELPGRITAGLAQRAWPEDAYPALALVIEQATSLRTLLDDALRALQGAKPSLGHLAAYQELRGEIRRYLRRQLEREAAWATEALVGERR